MTSQEDPPPEPLPSDSVESDAAVPAEPPEETVDAVPVLAEVRPIASAPRSALPAVQAVAAAATGFVAGAATIALVRRRTTRRLARGQQRPARRPVEMLPVLASRTFLVDVHVIGKPAD